MTNASLSEVSAIHQSAAIIRVENLHKTYRSGDVETPVLRGLNLTVARGEFLAVIGPSGSGKSTLFHILGGLTPPTAGEVWIDEASLAGMTENQRTDLRRRKIGFVFQKYNLLPTLTAADNIAVAQALAGRKVQPPGFQSILESLGIVNRLNHKPRALSGGEQQRVAIARALVNQPSILLADEPTGNLDTENSESVLRILQTLNRTAGQTILMITHNPEAAAYADRSVSIRDGKLRT